MLNMDAFQSRFDQMRMNEISAVSNIEATVPSYYGINIWQARLNLPKYNFQPISTYSRSPTCTLRHLGKSVVAD